MNKIIAFAATIAGLIASSGNGAAAAQTPARSTKKILESFAEDYKSDHMALNTAFGVKIGDEWWNVSVTRKEEDYPFKEKFTFQNFGPHEVVLKKGEPKTPTYYFEFSDKSVLDDVDNGALNIGAAAMKSFASDKVALELRDMEGFAANAGTVAESYHTMSHFGARGTPEVTLFERDKSLETHGASAVSLYMMKDKRFLWFSLGKNEAANDDSRLEYGQVPNLIIFTKGNGRGKFGDQELDLHPGMSVFVAPYVKHVFTNPNDEPLEGIVVLFGDNSDFAYGNSYMDFIEDHYEFLGDFKPSKE